MKLKEIKPPNYVPDMLETMAECKDDFKDGIFLGIKKDDTLAYHHSHMTLADLSLMRSLLDRIIAECFDKDFI